MKWILAALALLTTAASAGEPMTYALDGAYGSVAYEGKVQRVDAAESVLFTVEKLRLTLDPKAEVNSTEQLVRPSIRFITTVRAPDGVRAAVTYEALVRTDITLNVGTPHAVVENLRFAVPTSTLAGADYAGLSVTDGRLLWPMHHDMKP